MLKNFICPPSDGVPAHLDASGPTSLRLEATKVLPAVGDAEALGQLVVAHEPTRATRGAAFARHEENPCSSMFDEPNTTAHAKMTQVCGRNNCDVYQWLNTLHECNHPVVIL
jgi:hypothetical protein